jgi:phosphinothricin acetyltransferase
MPATIRLATEADAPAVLAIYGPFCHTPVSFETAEPTLEQMRERIAALAGKFPWLVCDDGGTVLGYAYASAHRSRPAYQWSVDVSAYIAHGHRRRGIGRALYTSLLATVTRQGFYNAYAGITLPNPGSVGLHEAVGFTQLGVYRGVGYKNGAWRDVGWWERLLRPRSQGPAPPLALSSVASVETIDAGNPLLRSPGRC